MSTWREDAIRAIGTADDFHIAPFHPDGVTTGTPTWIWSVIVEGRLFVRYYSGTSGRWYRAAIEQRAGIVKSGGRTYNVDFAPAPESWAGIIDDAYSKKYAGSPYLPMELSERVRAACVEVIPVSEAG